MKLISSILIFLGALSAGLSGAQTSVNEPNVRVAEIRGTINPAGASLLRTAIHQAQAEQAQALIIELDTPGGLVSSVKDMAQAIDQSTVPVVVFVTPAGAAATSAGALLSLASHLAAMSPGSHLGAAHPVDSAGKEVQGAMGEKILNDTVAFARGLAELRGRNISLAEQVVAKSRSLTAQEAHKEKLIEILASDRTDLLAQLDGRTVKISDGKSIQSRTLRTRSAEVRTSEMTWGQKILHRLADPNIATLLMTLGFLCIYVEISSPGIGIAGVLGAISLLTAFVAFQTLPIRTGGLILLALGAIFMIAEMFVATHGALAIGGALSFLLGMLWVMDPAGSDLVISPAVWIPATLGLFSGALVLAWAAARSQKLVKEARARMGGGGAAGLLGYTGHVQALGPDSRSGKALFRGEVWDFISSDALATGDAVQVEEVLGMRVRVKKA